MDFSCIIFGCLFTALGCLFALGKIHKHLPVWKNMPEDERNKINIVSLCRNIGEVIMLNGLIFLLKGVWMGFTEHWLSVAMVAWLIVAGFDVWHIAKSDRYINSYDISKKEVQTNEQKRK